MSKMTIEICTVFSVSFVFINARNKRICNPLMRSVHSISLILGLIMIFVSYILLVEGGEELEKFPQYSFGSRSLLKCAEMI